MLLYKIKYKPYNTVSFLKKVIPPAIAVQGEIYQILQNLWQKQFNLKLSNFWQIYAIFL